MSTPVPWQLAARKAPRVRKTYVYKRDPYNFSHVTTSNGTNPQIVIPCTGPHAAGAVWPVSAPTIESVQVTLTGTTTNVVYGVNRK